MSKYIFLSMDGYVLTVFIYMPKNGCMICLTVQDLCLSVDVDMSNSLIYIYLYMSEQVCMICLAVCVFGWIRFENRFLLLNNDNKKCNKILL